MVEPQQEAPKDAQVITLKTCTLKQGLALEEELQATQVIASP